MCVRHSIIGELLQGAQGVHVPEFRQNLVTGEWVILAQERANPHDHGAERSRCPFCPERGARPTRCWWWTETPS